VCGGDSTIEATLLGRPGPSPRVRGRRLGCSVRQGCAGTIPACAGETFFLRNMPLALRDHPRVCGGDQYLELLEYIQSGPSPRVRGRQRPRRHGVARQGTIPACAGETSISRLAAPPNMDHPRVCGGDGPPIPTCAGETAGYPPEYLQEWDHPRVCGGDP